MEQHNPQFDPRLQESLDDEERELMDAANWDWDSLEEGVPSPNAGAILEIRFTRDEVRRLSAAAAAAQMTPHAYIKRATLSQLADHATR